MPARQRHDPFLKSLYRLATPDVVRLFEPDIASRIRWETLQWIEKEISVPKPANRSVIADLVGKVQDVEGRYLEVLIHPEIQMEPDQEMDWRVLEYSAGLVLQRGHPRVRVLTFVFYHCAGAGGIQKRRFNMEFYGHTTLAVEYWSIGLGELDALEYARSLNPAAWALAAWMRKPRESRPELRLELQEKIARQVPQEPYRNILLDTVQTYFPLSRAEQARELELWRSRSHREAGSEMLSAFQKLEAKGRRKGRQEGQQAALQRALLVVLRSRFSTLPEGVEKRILKERSVRALDALFERVSAVERPEDLWPPQEQ